MSVIEKLQAEITQLTPPERRTLFNWLEEVVSDDWDRQIEADALAGKFDKLAEEALAEHRAGRSRSL